MPLLLADSCLLSAFAVEAVSSFLQLVVASKQVSIARRVILTSFYSFVFLLIVHLSFTHVHDLYFVFSERREANSPSESNCHSKLKNILPIEHA
jgi:hypothetical protein